MDLRRFEPADLDAVVALSLRAWAPVFASLERVLGPSGVFARQHPDWRVDQRRAVRDVCLDPAHDVRVALVDGAVAGFVAIRLDRATDMGEIVMLAVDPARQRRGIGGALTEFGLRVIREGGLTQAMVETGGDPGHGPARATYERAGFTALPTVRYFKNL